MEKGLRVGRPGTLAVLCGLVRSKPPLAPRPRHDWASSNSARAAMPRHGATRAKKPAFFTSSADCSDLSHLPSQSHFSLNRARFRKRTIVQVAFKELVQEREQVGQGCCSCWGWWHCFTREAGPVLAMVASTMTAGGDRGQSSSPSVGAQRPTRRVLREEGVPVPMATGSRCPSR